MDNLKLKDADVYILKLTPELASRFLECNIPENRTMKMRKVAEFEEIIRGGKWDPYCGDLMRMTDDGQWLIDGQTRCQAVINTGIAVDVLFSSRFHREDFGLVDAGSARSGADVIGSFFKKDKNVYGAILRTIVNVHRHGYTARALNNSKAIPNSTILDAARHADVDALVEAHDIAHKARRMCGGGSLTCYAWMRLVTLDINEKASNEMFDALGNELVLDKIVSTYRRRMSERKAKQEQITFLTTLNLLAPVWKTFNKSSPMTKIQVSDFKSIPKISGMYDGAGESAAGISDWSWLDSTEAS